MERNSFFIELTAAQTLRLAAQLQASGIDLAESAGTPPETDGVVLGYTIDRNADGGARVIFVVEKKPFFAPVSMIESAVRERMGLS